MCVLHRVSFCSVRKETYLYAKREHLPAPVHQEQMQGVRGGEHLPAPAPKEPLQGVGGVRASASTSAKGAHISQLWASKLNLSPCSLQASLARVECWGQTQYMKPCSPPCTRACPRSSPCKECGGASICQHQRRRSECKECGGASISQHQRIRSPCKECGGASICQHQRRRGNCKECGGASIRRRR